MSPTFGKSPPSLGLHGDSLILRLSAPDRAEVGQRHGGQPFEPMPGRPMKDYVAIPPPVRDGDEVDEWIQRSYRYAKSLPQKQRKG